MPTLTERRARKPDGKSGGLRCPGDPCESRGMPGVAAAPELWKYPVLAWGERHSRRGGGDPRDGQRGRLSPGPRLPA